MSFSNKLLNYNVRNSVNTHRNTTFVSKLAKLVCYFFIIDIRPNHRSNFCNHRCLKRFKKIFCISKVFGSWGWGIEILTMIGVQKCQFLAKSESWTTVYACCSCKLIINKCLVDIHILNFPLHIAFTKIVQFHISLI